MSTGVLETNIQSENQALTAEEKRDQAIELYTNFAQVKDAYDQASKEQQQTYLDLQDLYLQKIPVFLQTLFREKHSEGELLNIFQFNDKDLNRVQSQMILDVNKDNTKPDLRSTLTQNLAKTNKVTTEIMSLGRDILLGTQEEYEIAKNKIDTGLETIKNRKARRKRDS